MTDNRLVETGLGSVDWTGNTAPPGGAHTGTATITMLDGTTYAVAHNRAEVLRKLDTPSGPTSPAWVAFDVPRSAVPLVLNTKNFRSVT